MGIRTGAGRIDTFATARVLFILACQQAHADILKAGMRTIAATWGGQLLIRVTKSSNVSLQLRQAGAQWSRWVVRLAECPHVWW